MKEELKLCQLTTRMMDSQPEQDLRHGRDLRLEEVQEE